MTRTTELLKLYLEENTTLSPQRINEIVPTGYERTPSSDIEIDGGDETVGSSSMTKEDARKMRNIADDLDDSWKSEGIVSKYRYASQHGSSTSLKSMLNTYLQENKLMSDDNNKKAAFALKVFADITDVVANSEYLKKAAKDVCELVDGYSL